MNVHALRAWASVFGIGVATPIIITLAIIAGPAIEVFLYPVIDVDHVAGSAAMQGRDLCWDTHFKKLRQMTPAYFDYKINYNGVILAVNTYRITETGEHTYLSQYGFNIHRPGESWVSRYCFEVPKLVKPGGEFSVDGVAYYDSQHLFTKWNLKQDLPGFYVPGYLTQEMEP